MEKKEEIKLTYSAVLTKNQKPCVIVRFERGNDFAEGKVPECVILKKEGFSPEEVERLTDYLKNHAEELKQRAKEITGIKHWFS